MTFFELKKVLENIKNTTWKNDKNQWILIVCFFDVQFNQGNEGTGQSASGAIVSCDKFDEARNANVYSGKKFYDYRDYKIGNN